MEPAYRVLEQHAPELVARFSTTGVLAFVSPYVRALLAEPPNTLIGSSVFSLIAREDRGEVQRRLKALELVGRTREECRAHLIDAYGQSVLVQLALYGLRDAPELAPREFVMVARELEGTARLVMARELGGANGARVSLPFSDAPTTNARPTPEQLGRREQQLSALLSRAGLCHLRLDPQGRVLTIDSAALALLGYDQAALLVGKNAQRHLWRGPRSLAETLNQAQRDGGARVEAPLRCRDGMLRSVECVFEALRADDGSAIAVDVLLRDVTDERRDAWERGHAREAADAGSRAKSAFLANMSHEIRTPMNAILGMSHLALESDSLVKAREYLARIRVAGTGLLDVINDILDVSKIEAGKLELELAPFDLDRLIDTVATVIAVRASERRLELVLAIDPALPEVLVGDRARLTQVLLNLAGNAVKFTDRGEVVVGVDLLALGDGRAELRCVVRDSGTGISSEQLARLFEPFSQLETSNRRDRGTGLGLVIAQELVRCMGGEIEVESTPGLGSEFRFTLRLEVPAASASPLARIPNELKDWRVLVVDGNEAARTSLERSLLALGFTVCAVDSVSAALHAWEHDPRGFELVLLDCQAGGIALAHQLSESAQRERKPELVMLSTQPRDEVGDDLSFVRAFLRKPVSRSALIESILDAADGQRSGQRASSPPPQASVAPPKPLSELQLLVVEDNEINQILARDLLETAGATVVIASDGMEAIRLCATHEPAFDVILMDVQMPGLDGHATTRVLRAEPRTANTPIVAMTAHAFDAERKKCLASGMNAHVSKPISPPELVQTVLAWARPHSLEEARVRPSLLPKVERGQVEIIPRPLGEREPLRGRPLLSPRAPAGHITLSPGPGVSVDRLAQTAPSPPPNFDPSMLAAVFKDPARRLLFLRKFVDSARITLRELHGAWQRRADAEISFVGHKLKSSAKACGARALANLCADLEQYAKDGDWTRLAPLEGRADQLLAEVAQHVEALEADARASQAE